MLLKPKFWEKRVSATLEFWLFQKKKNKQKKRDFFMGAPWAPRAKNTVKNIPLYQFFTKKWIFNLFQKSGMLLKPKFWDFAVSATLEFLIFF